MPDVTRTVSRSTRLLCRLGYSRDDSLREVIAAAQRAAAKVSPAGDLSALWLGQLVAEAEARLRAVGRQSPTRSEAADSHARTTKQAAAGG